MRSLIILIGLVGLVALSSGDLGYDDADINDGGCNYPDTSLALGLFAYVPIANNYIPMASKSLYRFEYQVLLNKKAQSDAEIQSLQTRVKAFDLLSLIRTGGTFTVTFFGTDNATYSYIALPAVPATLPLPTNLLLNLTATTSTVSSLGSAPSGTGGTIVFTVVWSDGIAFTVWGCIEGRQNFHIISRNPTLTSNQLKQSKKILLGLGFNESNFQNMIYT